MIVSVTALGARGGHAAGAVVRVVDYLDGRRPTPAGRPPTWWKDNGLAAPTIDSGGPVSEPADGALAYYADSIEGPGTWLGRGLGPRALSGEVDRAQLARMLSGQDPATGRQLMDGRGSALRAGHLGREGPAVAPEGDPDELLNFSQAAALAGVSSGYLRRLARRTAEARAATSVAEGAELSPSLIPTPPQPAGSQAGIGRELLHRLALHPGPAPAARPVAPCGPRGGRWSVDHHGPQQPSCARLAPVTALDHLARAVHLGQHSIVIGPSRQC
ncbi:MAG: relaxase domain-containing protein [Acidimicrobiales bacterium]